MTLKWCLLGREKLPSNGAQCTSPWGQAGAPRKAAQESSSWGAWLPPTDSTPSLLPPKGACTAGWGEHCSPTPLDTRLQNHTPPGCLPHTPNPTIPAPRGRKFKTVVKDFKVGALWGGEVLLPATGMSSGTQKHG